MINIFKSGSGDYVANYIINLMGNLCELFILHFFFKNFKTKYTKNKTIILSIIFMMIQFVNTNLFLSKSYFIILGTFLFCFFISLLYENSWLNRILFSLFLYLILALPEIIIGMTLSLIFKIDISYTQNNILIFAICTLTSKFLSYVFVLITQKRNFKLEYSSSKQTILWIYSLPIASLLIMILFLRCCYQIDDFGFQIITLISSIVLTFANITVFYIVDKQNEFIETKEKLLFAEKHINSQIIHYEELYNHQSELNKFRHDIKNKFIALIGLLKNGHTQKAMEIMEENIGWLEENSHNIVNSGNPVIDAILQSKLHYAQSKGISIIISTKLIAKIHIDEIELGIVIGNALDNAIEAIEKCSNINHTHIHFNLISTEDRISISINNPVEQNIDPDNLQTTKKDKTSHGYGIKSMETIAKKYDGMVFFSCEDMIFTVNINLGNYTSH